MFCTQCGADNQNNALRCAQCGAPMPSSASAQFGAVPAAYAPAQSMPAQAVDRSVVPNEIKGFNFGAFAFSWIWAFVHRLWIPGILCFIPYLNFIVIIYLAFKGNEMAWKSREFTSVQQFIDTQRVWTRWGIIFFIICIGLGVLGVIAAIMIPVLLAQ
jgi:hypothetical protein